MSFRNPSCREVSELVSQREAGHLSLSNRLRVRYHVAMCALCRAFERQMGVITKGAKASANHHHRDISDEAEERIRVKFNEGMRE
jgi:hypothetical protein